MNRTTIRVARWELDVERDATREAYEATAPGVRCDCYDCQNFVRLGRDVFPADYHKILESLGIDYRMPAELCHYTRLESGLHHYGGWYHFIGKILSGDDSHRPVDASKTGWTIETEPIAGAAEIGFSDRHGLALDRLAGHSLVQVDIDVKLPWIIEGFESD